MTCVRTSSESSVITIENDIDIYRPAIYTVKFESGVFLFEMWPVKTKSTKLLLHYVNTNVAKWPMKNNLDPQKQQDIYRSPKFAWTEHVRLSENLILVTCIYTQIKQS